METHASQPELLPTTSEIRQAFCDEMTAIGGKVSDVYANDRFLYARAVLESFAEVRVGDRVQAGVALRAVGPFIQVHPYTSRLVCTNGAILEQASDSRRITRVELETSVVSAASAASYERAAVLSAVGEAARACGRPEAFTDAVEQMRSATEQGLDDEFALLTIFSRICSLVGEEEALRMMARFNTEPDPDRSAFGLLNALTSAGRDARDPETRWRLEALGARVPALLVRDARRVPAERTEPNPYVARVTSKASADRVA